MKTIVTDQDNIISSWVARQVGVEGFAPHTALGYVRDGKLLAGVVFTQYYPGRDIQMIVAAQPGSRWVTKDFAAAVFSYPFIQLKLPRVTVLVDETNQTALKFDLHLGFVREGLMRKAGTDGQDLIILGMLREECRWLPPVTKEETDDGQEIRAEGA